MFQGLLADIVGKVKIVEHKIDVGEVKPIRQQPYRVTIADKEIIDMKVEKVLVNKIIRPSVSPWFVILSEFFSLSRSLLPVKIGVTVRFCYRIFHLKGILNLTYL